MPYKNVEDQAAHDKRDHEANRDRDNAKSMVYFENHRDAARIRCCKYYAAHPDERKEKDRLWKLLNPDKFKRIMERHTAKRRTLGFSPLNLSFDGAEPHHINQSDVIYIPATLHHSVWHCVWTGKNMDKINTLAYEWLAKESE